MNALTNPIHWLPQDPDESPMTACGLNVDARDEAGGYPSWSRSRTPYGKPPTCPTCAKEAA